MDIGGTTMVGTIHVILYLNHPHSRNQATVTLPDTYAIDLQQLISLIMPNAAMESIVLGRRQWQWLWLIVDWQ